MIQWRVLLPILGLGLLPLHSAAQVIPDGSLGTIPTFNSPEFHITEELGQRVGNNLFHSFQQFDLNKEQTATFSGSPDIQHIFSRITNGKPSQIDGTIRSTIPQANLYFLNPAGFIFNENAHLDITGDLHISTAHQVQLGQNGHFFANPTTQSILISAPPTAFGFLTTGKITIEGSELITPRGKTLTVAAEHIDITNGVLEAIAGKINLIGINPYQPENLINLQTLTTQHFNPNGSITLQNAAAIDVGKQGEGNVYIRAGKFVLDNSEILANADRIDSGTVDIQAHELRLQNNARIDSQTFALGKGGDLLLAIEGLALINDSTIVTSALSTNPEAGNAGNIHIRAKELDIKDSTISSETKGAGNGGNIDLTIQTNLHITAREAAAGIKAKAASQDKTEAGNAGNIQLTAQNIVLTGNVELDNSTRGNGQAGSITLNARDHIQLQQARISSDTESTGNAGIINLNSKQLTLNEGATISTRANLANGGNILLNIKKKVTLDQASINATVSSGNGNGGNVVLTNPHTVQLTDSTITANASEGNGGLILLIAGQPLISTRSAITASSETGTDGNVRLDFFSVDTVSLPTEFLNVVDLIQKSCATQVANQALSSFTVIEQRPPFNTPEDLQTYLPLE